MLQVVDSELMLALLNLLRPPTSPATQPAIAMKAMQLVGKLGVSNQAFMKTPLTLECKANPEHGLRLILTFEPSTSFLARTRPRCSRL